MRKIIRGCIITVMGATVLLAGCGKNSTEDDTAGQAETVVKKISVEAGTTEDSETDEEETETVEEEYEGASADYEALQSAIEVNDEVYAWMDIPGTGLSFAIAQPADDQSYYLTHTWDRSEDDDGAIYTEYYNTKDFSDFLTVIYGKYRDDRFKTLFQYEDEEFREANRDIYITLSDGTVLTYYVFAEYINDDNHMLLNRDFSSVLDREEYAASLPDAHNGMSDYYDTDISIDSSSQMIALMTGVPEHTDERYVVQALKVSR